MNNETMNNGQRRRTMKNEAMNKCFSEMPSILREESGERGSYDQESRIYSGRLLKNGINSALP
jgi:hypothetical protein